MAFCVFLGNLSFQVTQNIVAAIAEAAPYAVVDYVQIIRRGRANEGKTCCAFVALGSDSELQEVIRGLNGSKAARLTGSYVRAEPAVPRMVDMAKKASMKGQASSEEAAAWHVCVNVSVTPYMQTISKCVGQDF